MITSKVPSTIFLPLGSSASPQLTASVKYSTQIDYGHPFNVTVTAFASSEGIIKAIKVTVLPSRTEQQNCQAEGEVAKHEGFHLLLLATKPNLLTSL